MTWSGRLLLGAIFALLLIAGATRPASAQSILPTFFPEERSLQIRDPADLPFVPLPAEAPPTVSTKPANTTPLNLTLDETIRISLANAKVIRILAGTTATASGRTVYDAAITNTTIDQANARFDPSLRVNNSWNRTDIPSATFLDPLNPAAGSQIIGRQTNNYNLDLGLTKQNAYGGTSQLSVTSNRNQFSPGVFPLNPQTSSSAAVGYTQPWLQGAGLQANLAPIVIARIDTERSYFQLKDSLQELVRGTIEAYWNLVAARVEMWVRQRQVDQADFAFRLADARARVQIQNAAERAQARVTLATFRANLIGAEAVVIQREAALRNLIGLPPADGRQIVPTTSCQDTRYKPQWDALIGLAGTQRPDLIELKLILEADQQLVLQARNNAQPALDTVALYRWNGLEGEAPNSMDLATRPGQFTDWTLGVNFAVPIGLRQARAQLRQRELLLARDRANLQQGVHVAAHALASTLRDLDRAYEQYLAFKEAREAAMENLRQQLAQFRASRVIFLNVLQAINDWGTAVNSEALALTAYNSQLGRLERESGTILEAHGVRMYEEKYGSLGPLVKCEPEACYPETHPPTPNNERYPAGTEPSEKSFRLDYPQEWRKQNRDLLPPLEDGDAKPPLELPPPVEDVPTPTPKPQPQSSRRQPVNAQPVSSSGALRPMQ